MTQSILLDTCAAIWIMDGAWMRPAAVAMLDEAADRGDRIFVSPITGWEIGNQVRSGRFRSSLTPRRWLANLLAQPQIAVAALSPEILLETGMLPGELHKDPADRIFAATAREYGLTLMTRDRPLLEYARQGYMSALEC